jgi:hypothetical protein
MISTLLAATLGIIATPVIQTLDPSTLRCSSSLLSAPRSSAG